MKSSYLVQILGRTTRNKEIRTMYQVEAESPQIARLLCLGSWLEKEHLRQNRFIKLDSVSVTMGRMLDKKEEIKA